MPVYYYEAADRDGRKSKAVAEALDETSLREDLRKKGLVPLSITPKRGRRAGLLRRVTRKDVLTFTQELGSLLESGLPVDRALYVLAEHAEKAELREIIRQVYLDIQQGQSLSQALSRHRAFPKLYVNMIRAGEAGGTLEVVIRRLASFLETVVALRDETVSALIYPSLLTLVGGLAVVVLMLYVVPKFSVIFADMGQALPLPTLVLLTASEWFVSYWYIIAAAAAGGALLLEAYLRTSEGRLFLDGLKLRVPLVRSVHLKLAIARFSRTLGTLLQSGVPVMESIRVSREVLGNRVLSERLQALEDGVRKGRGVAAPLRESRVFPSIVAQMIATGEEAGRLEDTFISVAERFEAESKRLIKRTVGLIEPVMILVMGLIVGFIVISMLMAVFSINEIPI
ncbi:MAG: type II secretion system F family protein [Thermodesulfovibrionales bacterium]